VIPATCSIIVDATGFNPNSNPRATAAGQSSNYGDKIVVSAPGNFLHDMTCGGGGPLDYTNLFGGTSERVSTRC
jgi:hypothetical protein